MFKACRSVCSSVCYRHYKGGTPTKSVKISTLDHNFLSDYCRDVYSTLNKDFCWSPRAKCIIGRDLKFAGYVPHYKILTGNNFGLILKNKMAATGVSLSVMKSAYISLIIFPRGLGW